MTANEICELVYNLKKVFDIVRLVDVALTTQFTLSASGELIAGEYECYAVWNKNHRCENCISARAFAQKTRLTKYEFVDNDVYHVVAKYIEVGDTPFVLEIVSNVTDKVLFGAAGKEHFIETIQQHNELLYKDPLTGAYNREYYEEQLQSLQHAHALAMVDVDDFKKINDTFGHQAGDAALKLIVRIFLTNMRSIDTVIRYGGDEFLLVFKEMSNELLTATLEHLRQYVEQAHIEEYPDMKMTISMGCSGIDDGDKDRVRCADLRLYKAKTTKNTVCFE